MNNLIFVACVASVLGGLYFWAFKHLPHERWQVLGTIPLRKQTDGQWQGLNLTFYGLFNACAVTFALFLTLFLLVAAGFPLKAVVLTVCGLLMLCAPSAKWIARLVEKKKHTFTIGGAAFCGMVGSPLVLLALQPAASRFFAMELPVMPFIAAMAIGYAFGEGCGRLACLSFGCCYGKPIDALPARLQRLAQPFSLVFYGNTKKAAYADGLCGRRVLAIQAITAVVYTLTGLIGLHLYLESHLRGAYLTCVLTTQIWRILSEFARADYRGGRKISAYQYMAGITALSGVIYDFFLPAAAPEINLTQGLHILWNPAVLLSCQVLWMGIFLFTGRSKVTAARISLFVHSDRI